MAVDSRITNAWAQMVAAANNYAAKNRKQYSASMLPKGLSAEYIAKLNADPYAANRAAASPGDIAQLHMGSPDSWMLDKEVAAAYGNYLNVSRTAVHEDRGYIPKAPEPAQDTSGRGQLRVDLDTSPVQTADSVMYRNAGEGEDNTIGEASRPNKRKPGLSSNLGINL